MKKIKKPLLINVPQDDHHQAKSPSRIGLKQNKQKPLLLFNENTISSSVNNEDDFHMQNEKGMQICEEFTDYHTKIDPSTKQSQQVSSNRLQRNKKFNIIQFEQFMVEGSEKPKLSQTGQLKSKQKRLLRNYHKREFSIQIPQQQQRYQNKQQTNQMSIKFAFDLKNNQAAQKNNRQQKQNVMKQPPAPSNKLNQANKLTRRFVFPTNDEQQMLPYQENKNFGAKSFNDNNINNKQKTTQKQLIRTDFISHQDHQSIVNQIHIQYQQKLEQINKSFQKQRQQFYREKSSLQKDLMIKDGQIEMLQRLITNRYSPTNSNINHQQQKMTTNNNNYGENNIDLSINTKKQSLSQSISIENSKILYVSDQKITAMETLLLQKDLQINTLLQKINQLNSIIDHKNNQLEEVKVALLKSQKINQSLRNQIFLHQKKEQSQKLTQQFYKVKQTLIQVQKSTKTPKAALSRPKWHQDQSLQKDKQFEKSDYPFRGIDDLQRLHLIPLPSGKQNRK